MDLKLLCLLSLFVSNVFSISLRRKGRPFGGLSRNLDRRSNLQGQLRGFKKKCLVPPENNYDESDKKLSGKNIEVHHVPVKVVEPPELNLPQESRLNEESQPIPPLVVAEIVELQPKEEFEQIPPIEVAEIVELQPNEEPEQIPPIEVAEIVELQPKEEFEQLPPIEVAEIVELQPNEESEQIPPIEVVEIVEQPVEEGNNHKGTKPNKELDPIILIKDTNPLTPLEVPGVEYSDEPEDWEKFPEVIETPVIVSPNLSWNPEIPVGDSILGKKRRRPKVFEAIEVPETPIIVNPNHGWNSVISVGGSLQDKKGRRPKVIETPDIVYPNQDWNPEISVGGPIQDKKGRRPEVEIIEVPDTPVIVNPYQDWNPEISVGGPIQDKKGRRPEVEIIEVPDTPVTVNPNQNWNPVISVGDAFDDEKGRRPDTPVIVNPYVGWNPYGGNFNPYQFWNPYHQVWNPHFPVWGYRNPYSYPSPNQSWQPVFPNQQLQDLRNRIVSHQEQPVPNDTKPAPPEPKKSATPAPQPPIPNPVPQAAPVPVFVIPNNIPNIPEMPAEDEKGGLNSRLNSGLDPGPYPYPEHKNPVVIIPEEPPYQKHPDIKIYNNEHPGQRPVPKEAGHKPVPENQDNNVITIMEKHIGLDWLGIVVILACIVIFIMVICLVCCLCYKRHKSKVASLESILVSSDSTNISGKSKRYKKSNKHIYKLLPTPSGSSTDQSSDEEEEVYEKESPRKKRIREQISRETKHAKNFSNRVSESS